MMGKLFASITQWGKDLKVSHPTVWAALKTGIAAFMVTFTPAVIMYGEDIREWLVSQGSEDFPLPASLLEVGISALFGAGAAVYNFLWNKWKNNIIKYDKKD